MKRILLAACAVLTLAGASHARDTNSTLLEFPGEYEGEWCQADDNYDPDVAHVYAHQICDNPATRVVIALDSLSERDARCRLISGSKRAGSFVARLKCRSSQGGHPQSWEMTLQMKWVSNTDTMEVRNEWNR